jgi:hypothetical protein
VLAGVASIVTSDVQGVKHPVRRCFRKLDSEGLGRPLSAQPQAQFEEIVIDDLRLREGGKPRIALETSKNLFQNL